MRGLLLLCVIAAAIVGGYLGWLRYWPNNEMIVPDYGAEHPVVFDGGVLEEGAKSENGEIKLTLNTLRAVLGEDAPIRYEADSGSIIMTTSDKVLHMKTDALTATVNSKPVELTIAAESAADDSDVYIPLAPVTELYGLQAELAEATGIVTLLLPGQPVQRAQATGEEAAVRSQPTVKAPIVEKVAPGAAVRIWGEEQGWYVVQGPAGYVGYAAKRDFALTDVETVAEPERGEPFIAWEVMGSKINLTWEAVYSVPADPAKIGPMPGVNVISPTWFELMNEQGQIRSKADRTYVAWAHERKMQVWALFSNSFEPDRTTTVLASYETRFHMIQQLLSYAQIYRLQGINIDFENVYTKDKENLVQFVREFTPLAHEQGLVVSIDVTPKSNSEMWSAFLDRRALAQSVDFMMVMAYDEHWASSPVAGSVASLPWVEAAIVKILEEDDVPPEKLVLGAPLYTRIWTETKDENGQVKVSSRAVGMETIGTLLAERRLKPEYRPETGQHYVEYEEDGALNKIWIEDETSAKARAELVRKYGLAGISTWQRGFQKAEIWPVIRDALEARP